MAEVARSAGVSVPTVSKVLNGRADVAAATRARVEEALAASGYRRRAVAAPQPVGLVDLVIDSIDTPWALEVVRGGEQAAARAGASLVVTTTHSGRVAGRRWLETLTSRRSDGYVLVISAPAPEALEQLAELHTPLVLLDPVGGSDPSLPTVGATNWAGGRAATEHLLALGHRRIGIVTGHEWLACSQERLDGYRAALRRAGVPVDEHLVRFGDFHPEGGRRGAAALLDLEDPPTAVFAGSDLQACGVYEEAHARGLRIPDDLSVVGFDDISLCRYLTPPLTTIRQPLADMAEEAVRLVLELGRLDALGERPRRTRVELATELVERASTAAPLSGGRG
jgi:DNA-binding LacI/PurR family transcriptional regulator